MKKNTPSFDELPEDLVEVYGATVYVVSEVPDADGTFTVDSFPSGYGDTGSQVEGNSAGAAAAWGFLSVSETDTEDPGVFGISTTRQWATGTVMFLEAGSSLRRRR